MSPIIDAYLCLHTGTFRLSNVSSIGALTPQSHTNISFAIVGKVPTHESHQYMMTDSGRARAREQKMTHRLN